MKRIVLMVIALLVLLAMPAIAHQAPPSIGFGLAVESLAVVAIDTGCLDLKIEQATLEKVIQDSNPRLSENLTQWAVYTTATQESNSAGMAFRGEWLDNIGYNSL